ncbi:MAG: hypothetical protein AAB646_02565 [Patescibacteria group bacterium]
MAKSVTFCSSQRFKTQLDFFIHSIDILASRKGFKLVVFDPEFRNRPDNFHLLSEKDRMNNEVYRSEVAGRVYDHLFRKVRVTDVTFIFNKDGYLGANTIGELFAAAAWGKIIYALEDKTLMGQYPDGLYLEPSARKLIHEVVATPCELLKRLL